MSRLTAVKNSAANLAVSRVTAEVLRALEAAGVEPILLKGPPATKLLYASENARASCDVDLLVPPSDIERCRTVLGDKGYKLQSRAVDAPGGGHAEVWEREPSAVTVDLHRTIIGVGAVPSRLFLMLRETVVEVQVAGARAQVPVGHGSALVVALHAASHGADNKHALSDLQAALVAFPEDVWARARDLAHALDAEEAFDAGMSLAYGSPVTTSSVEVLLRAGSAPHTSVGFERLSRERGLIGRCRLLVHSAFPPARVLRAWHPFARRGGGALVLVWLVRLLWLTWWAPSGFAAWVTARQRIRPRRPDL